LGNIDTVTDVLRIAAGMTLEDLIVSNISQIAARITLPGESPHFSKWFS
jgi:hypothetical protein